jgi:hypothetical protein
MAIARVDEFIAKLRSLTDPTSIENLCISELDYLRDSLTTSSVKSSLTKYRNAIRSLGDNFDEELALHALRFLTLSKEESIDLKHQYKEQLQSDHTSLRFVKDVDAVILKAEELLESEAYTALAVGIACLTGRRLTEILKTAKFEFIDEEHILFTGQLKTKESENAKIAPYPIPVLSTASILIEALAKLRQLRDFSALTNDQVHSKTNKSCSEQVKRHFSALIPNCKVKDLRALYATICCEYFKPDDYSDPAYMAMILGHSELDLITPLSYQDFRI